jgi:hypothetical protein
MRDQASGIRDQGSGISDRGSVMFSREPKASASTNDDT